MSSDIRLKYSGLVIFLSKVLSIFTGLLFSVILTHAFSTPEFGVWTNIIGVLSTFGVASGVFPFWAARYTARRFEGAMKLGLLANSAIAIPVAGIIAIVGPYLASAAQTSSSYYFFAALIVVQSYIIVALDSVVTVVKTHVIGYAFLAFEIIKLALAYPLLLIFHLGISAALLAIFIANIGWTIIYVIVLSRLWFQKINYRHFTEWIRGSSLNFYGVGAGLLTGLEGYILLFRAGTLSLAYFGAATLVVGPIGYTISLSAALYPKLLSGGTAKDAETLLHMSLLFSIPLTVATVALSPSLLAILNPNFVLAGTILTLLAIRGLAYTFGGMFDAIISGTEKLDAEGRIRLEQVMKSRIFLSTTIAYAVYPLYLPILWILLQPFANDPVGAARTTALAGLVVTSLTVGLKYFISTRSLPFKFPLRSSLKFLIASLILVGFAALFSQPLEWFVTIALFAAGSAIYFAILYCIDDEAKILIQSIWQYGSRMLRSLPILGRLF